MSEEPVIQRRTPSPAAIARRAERLLMIPFRERVAELQSRVAFLSAARSVAFKGTEPETIEAGLMEAAADIEATLKDIDAVISGPSVGPADDCRRALRVL